MSERNKKSVWPYWVCIITLAVGYVMFGHIGQSSVECDRLKESYLIAVLDMDIVSTISVGGASAVREAKADLALTQHDLVKQCGSYAILEAEQYYARNGQVIVG